MIGFGTCFSKFVIVGFSSDNPISGQSTLIFLVDQVSVNRDPVPDTGFVSILGFMRVLVDSTEVLIWLLCLYLN